MGCGASNYNVTPMRESIENNDLRRIEKLVETQDCFIPISLAVKLDRWTITEYLVDKTNKISDDERLLAVVEALDRIPDYKYFRLFLRNSHEFPLLTIPLCRAIHLNIDQVANVIHEILATNSTSLHGPMLRALCESSVKLRIGAVGCKELPNIQQLLISIFEVGVRPDEFWQDSLKISFKPVSCAITFIRATTSYQLMRDIVEASSIMKRPCEEATGVLFALQMAGFFNSPLRLTQQHIQNISHLNSYRMPLTKDGADIVESIEHHKKNPMSLSALCVLKVRSCLKHHLNIFHAVKTVKNGQTLNLPSPIYDMITLKDSSLN